MRITNGMVAENALQNINKAANRMAAASAAVSSNKKIQLASDDPVVATRAVTYRSYVSQITQYQENAKAADAWQTATDTALTSLAKVFTTLQEQTTAAANGGTLTDANLDSYAKSIKTLRDEAITIMNSTSAGRYIFGGYSTSEAPYEVVSTDIGDTVTFKGDYLSLGGVVSVDIADADIIAFYNANDDSVYNSLTDAAATALTASDDAALAAAVAPNDTTLATRALAAKNTSDTLAKAVTTYGGSTTLTTAAAAAKTASTTIAAAVTTYGGTTTLTAAAADALTAYTTAKAASDADSTNTTLAATTTAAKATSDSLAAAVTTYGGATTLTAAATAAKTDAATLATAATNTDQDINYNIGFSSEVTVNIEGQDVIGEGTDSNLFDTFAKLLLALNGDTSYKTAEQDASGNVTVTTKSLDLSALLADIATDLDRMTTAQSTLGARMDNVDNVISSLGDAYTVYKDLMSDNENINTAEAATELTSAEYTYQAALAVGAKVSSKSLIDYIA